VPQNAVIGWWLTKDRNESNVSFSCDVNFINVLDGNLSTISGNWDRYQAARLHASSLTLWDCEKKDLTSSFHSNIVTISNKVTAISDKVCEMGC
jgi:hypothetical protein